MYKIFMEVDDGIWEHGMESKADEAFEDEDEHEFDDVEIDAE